MKRRNKIHSKQVTLTAHALVENVKKMVEAGGKISTCSLVPNFIFWNIYWRVMKRQKIVAN